MIYHDDSAMVSPGGAPTSPSDIEEATPRSG